MNDPEYTEFDINILQDALTSPNIELTFPLPTDKKTYLPLKSNEEVKKSFQLLEHFVNFFTNINVFEIYKNAEYKYSVLKASKQFNEKSELFMNDRLEKSDEKLDQIVYDLIDLELKMNLITAKEFPKRFKEVKAFMVQYYKQENSKNLPKFGSHSFIRLCYITVINIVTKMFPQGVWTSKEQFSTLYKTYLKDPMSIILLPNHQSHIDYVILHLIMIRFQMSVPTVIAGDNLNVAIFGSILKGLGGIFIKRSFNNEAYTERNLTNYVEFILLNKIHFEVFIEGTRSRDGKLLLPKYGILKTLATIYQKQREDEQNSGFDFLIQPVSVTYERVYEADGYLDELIGKDKKQESFFSILSNGVSNMISKNERSSTFLLDGFVDNSNATLNGKIFVSLAKNFTYSSHYNDTSNLAVLKSTNNSLHMLDINLKKLGFKILHSINDTSYVPECALVGFTIQTYYYLEGRKEFFVKDLLPTMEFLTGLLEGEDLNRSNIELLGKIRTMAESQKVALIESQITRFLRYTRVNPMSKRVKIVNSFELLYYKNLSIHLIINKCLTSLILLVTLDITRIKKIYYILISVLKNEFLFDYDTKERHKISNILDSFQKSNLISHSYEIIDTRYHEILATIVRPFIQSFAICVDSLISSENRVSAGRNNISEQQLIDDTSLLKNFPTTKSLLKSIQKNNERNFENDSASYHIETYNKQYLLSHLFYLDNLKVIKILKNKSRTKAYVLIKNKEDLHFIAQFMKNLGTKNLNEVSLSYMTDIVDKNPSRIIRHDTKDSLHSKL